MAADWKPLGWPISDAKVRLAQQLQVDIHWVARMIIQCLRQDWMQRHVLPEHVANLIRLYARPAATMACSSSSGTCSTARGVQQGSRRGCSTKLLPSDQQHMLSQVKAWDLPASSSDKPP
jgi:hypothetical protein